MNEDLVKRLIGDASKIDFNENKVLWESTGTIFHMEDMFRLTELIIRECAKILLESRYKVANSDYYEGFNEALVYSAYALEERFGLEEDV